MRYPVLLLAVFLVVGVCSAVPAAMTVSAVGNNNVTFSATSIATEAWFEYGMTPTTLVVYTPNQTAGGPYTWTEVGSPLSSGEKYYVAACDNTGCSATQTFTLLDATPLPTSTYGKLYTNATRNKFDLLMVIPNIPLAFTWLFPQTSQALALSIVAALVLFSIFFGLAYRTRYVAIPVVVGLITAPYLLYQNQGVGLGIPVEFQAIAQGITYACVAGILMLILKK